MINSIVLERCQNRLPVFSSHGDVLTNGKARPSKQFQKSSWAPQIPSPGPPGARASPLAKMAFSSFGRPSKVPGQTGPVKLINSTVLSRCQNRLPKSEPREKSLRFLRELAVSGFFSGFWASSDTAPSCLEPVSALPARADFCPVGETFTQPGKLLPIPCGRLFLSFFLRQLIGHRHIYIYILYIYITYILSV